MMHVFRMVFSRRTEMVDDEMAEMLRAKTPAERLAIGHGLWSFVRRTILSMLRQEHPDWSDQELEKEAARRISHGAV